MELASEADALRRERRHEQARDRYSQALELDRQAALLVSSEPSRGILFRSAAWLALEAEQAREAERLAAAGLASADVPEKVANELRQVMEQARVQLVAASPPPSGVSSIGLHLEGPGVGWGEAEEADITMRAEALRKLVYRTAERRAGYPFRTKPTVPPEIRKQTSPRLQISPGSVSIRLILGGANGDLLDRNADLVEDLVERLSVFAQGDDRKLSELIPDPSYNENFRALALSIGPDDKRISAVAVSGASSLRKLIPFRLPKPPKPERRPNSTEETTFEGELRAVDETRKTSSIRLVDDEGTVRQLVVSDVLMDDIVRPFYGYRIRVTALRKGQAWHLSGMPDLV